MTNMIHHTSKARRSAGLERKLSHVHSLKYSASNLAKLHINILWDILEMILPEDKAN